MITAGIESGSRHTKTVIMEGDTLLSRWQVRTGFDLRQAARDSLEQALARALTRKITRQDIHKLAVTGSGKERIDLADLVVEDENAMGKGAVYACPTAGTVADIGYEDGRAARVSPDGKILDAAHNEKCAAGAGSFVETMARLLETDLDEMGPLALTSDQTIPMNSQCVVFAESEVVTLLHSGTPKRDICRAVHDALAERVVSLIRRVGIHGDVVLLGGMGRNPGFITPVEKALGFPVVVPEAPEFGSAIGAAIAAQTL